jgi:cytochrome P450
MTRLIRPPGPRTHYLIGSFPFPKADLLRLLPSWARRYGDIFYFRAFGFHLYFLNHPDYFEYVLVSNSRNFIKGRSVQASRCFLGNGLLTSEGDFWLHQRHLAQGAFHRHCISEYGSVMVDCTQRMVAGWHDGEVRDVYQDMLRLCMDIAARTLFGADLARQADEVGAAIETVLEEVTGGVMQLPFLVKLPTLGNLRLRRAVRRLDKVVWGMIHQRRNSERSKDDLLSLLLRAHDDGDTQMTDQQLRDEVITLFLAGYEPCAVALSWTWYLLSQHPEVEAKLWEELRTVLAGRPPGVADLPQLRFSEKVMKESMRLYPPAWIISRETVSECEIGGYRVPAGTQLAMSAWVTHRDGRYFADPEVFNPDRWTDELTAPLPRFAYFPFGGGPRLCIGAAFTMTETVLLLATIAQRFRFSLLRGHPVTPEPAITLRPKQGIRVVVRERGDRTPTLKVTREAALV